MFTQRLFDPANAFYSNVAADYFIFTIIAAMLVLAIRFSSLRSKFGLNKYNSILAWHRAGIAFCAAYIIGWSTGAFKTLLQTPFVTDEQLQNPVWIALTLTCFVIIIIGYGVIWPKGTLVYDRQRRLPSILIFGLLWGTSQALMFLSIWALIEMTGLSTLWVALLSYAVIASYNGSWHNFYWDIHVSPEHNIEEWNVRKVLLAHTPNLLFTLTYLALFGSIWVFVCLQTLALLLSCYFMHFPGYADVIDSEST